MGPLQGLKAQEFEGIGPGPLAGMQLKKHLGGAGDMDILNPGKQQPAIDLKTPAEAAPHPHNLARQTYSNANTLQANPAPRFSRTVPSLSDKNLTSDARPPCSLP